MKMIAAKTIPKPSKIFNKGWGILSAKLELPFAANITLNSDCNKFIFYTHCISQAGLRYCHK
jgi:hypothetical protein